MRVMYNNQLHEIVKGWAMLEGQIYEINNGWAMLGQQIYRLWDAGELIIFWNNYEGLFFFDPDGQPRGFIPFEYVMHGTEGRIARLRLTLKPEPRIAAIAQSWVRVLHAFTGEIIWEYKHTASGVNATPTVCNFGPDGRLAVAWQYYYNNRYRGSTTVHNPDGSLIWKVDNWTDDPYGLDIFAIVMTDTRVAAAGRRRATNPMTNGYTKVYDARNAATGAKLTAYSGSGGPITNLVSGQDCDGYSADQDTSASTHGALVLLQKDGFFNTIHWMKDGWLLSYLNNTSDVFLCPYGFYTATLVWHGRIAGNYVVRHDWASGEEIWRFAPTSDAGDWHGYRQLAVDKAGRVYVARSTENGCQLLAYLAEGQPLWEFLRPSRPSPSQNNCMVVAGPHWGTDPEYWS